MLSTYIIRPDAQSLSPAQVLIGHQLAENYDLTEPLPDCLSALLRELGGVRLQRDDCESHSAGLSGQGERGYGSFEWRAHE
jgi:hypothetical protein